MPTALSSFRILLELDGSTTCFARPGANEKPLLEKRMFEIQAIQNAVPHRAQTAASWEARADCTCLYRGETESDTRQTILQEPLGSPPGEVLRCLVLASSILCPLLWPPESPPAVRTGCTQS